MNKYEVVVSKTQEDVAVVTASKIRFNLGNGMPGASQDQLSDGSFDIDGDFTLNLLNQKEIVNAMPKVSVRLREWEIQLAALPQNSSERAKLQAKFDIWNTFLLAFQGALAIALEQNYELENP